MKYHSTIEGNKLLIHTTVWMNLKCIVLRKMSLFQKVVYHMIPLIGHSQKDDRLSRWLSGKEYAHQFRRYRKHTFDP